MKVIKINQDHYIIVDDSEIKDYDWSRFDYSDFSEMINVITHSTRALEPVDGTYIYYKIKPLSLQEVKELIGERDVEKKAINSWEGCHGCDTNDELFFINGYQRGYNQCIEDNKEKKYTEEDMIRCWNASRDYTRILFDPDGIGKGLSPSNREDFIQSLQPKTEWEVEFVNAKLKLK